MSAKGHIKASDHAPTRFFAAGIFALLIALTAVFVTGCSSQVPEDLTRMTLNSFLSVDQGTTGYDTIETDAGEYPAGWLSFALVPGIDALKHYQEETDADATVDDMLQAWSDAITTVKLGDYVLEAKPYEEWKSAFTDEKNDRKNLRYYDLELFEESVVMKVPVAFFDSYENNMSTEYLNIEAEGFDDVEAYVRFCNYAPTSFTVRVYDKAPIEGGVLQQEYTLTDDELRKLSTQSGFNSTISNGSIGLTSFYGEGVYLTDILDELDVEFKPGMTIQPFRINYSTIAGTEPTYSSLGAYTYESLMATPRYYYPAMWDDETTYDELGGATVAEVLAENTSAWQGDDEQSRALARIIGASKEELEGPLIAWECNVGVAYVGGPDPRTQTYGDYTYNQYSEYERYYLLYGTPANDDGSIMYENTPYNDINDVFGIDVYPTSGDTEK